MQKSRKKISNDIVIFSQSFAKFDKIRQQFRTIYRCLHQRFY